VENIGGYDSVKVESELGWSLAQEIRLYQVNLGQFLACPSYHFGREIQPPHVAALPKKTRGQAPSANTKVEHPQVWPYIGQADYRTQHFVVAAKGKNALLTVLIVILRPVIKELVSALFSHSFLHFYTGSRGLAMRHGAAYLHEEPGGEGFPASCGTGSCVAKTGPLNVRPRLCLVGKTPCQLIDQVPVEKFVRDSSL